MNTSKSLPMTDEEILASFNNAAVPSKQVKILSELNLTSQERIIGILTKMGVDGRRLPHRRKKPKPEEETESTEPEKQQCIIESTIYTVSDVLAKVKAAREELLRYIAELEEETERKKAELAKVEKLIPPLEQCEREVRAV